MPRKRIYVVDDEPKMGQLFVNVLTRDGYEATAFGSPLPMLEALVAGPAPDLVLTDLMMPGMSGMELIRTLKARGVGSPVIIMTAHSSVKTAVEAMQMGALHYLQKPVNLEEMRALIARALDLDSARQELAEIKKTQQTQFGIDGIRGESEGVRAIRQTLQTLRGVGGTTVLIRGETGTGKNLVAKTIHFNSPQSAGRFMEINCAALPDNLLEAELFGYEKGAFTDARASKQGLLEIADGGTLFLDEIDSMSPALQSKLLSFLESRMFRRLSGVDEIKVSTRILCATNADLEARVADKTFRKDLFYRINVVVIELPPLRSMGRDVVLMAREVVAEMARGFGRDVRGLTPEAETKLLLHGWPGNVRELRNVIERALIFSRGPLVDAASLVLTPSSDVGGDGIGLVADGTFLFPENRLLDDLERAYIQHTLRRTQGSFTEVAALLGISKKTLWEKRKRYGLDEEKGA